MNVFDLNSARDLREIQKIKTYHQILDRIHKKIKHCAHQRKEYIDYIIPEFVYGLPPFNLVECSTYITLKLRENGFIVYFTYPNYLIILWGHIPSEVRQPELKEISDEIKANPDVNHIPMIQSVLFKGSNNQRRLL